MAEMVERTDCPIYEKTDTTSPFSNNNYNFIMDTPVRRDRMIALEGTNLGMAFKNFVKQKA